MVQVSAQVAALPKRITTPDKTFLLKLLNASKSFSAVVSRILTVTEKEFVALVKSSVSASKWGLTQYKTFIMKATPLIKSRGIRADEDDGGEIFGDLDNGSEIFSSSGMGLKFINKLMMN